MTGFLFQQHRTISIHALREEGDVRDAGIKKVCRVFLSTPSARRATSGLQRYCPECAISIHALREEGDRLKIYIPPTLKNFYPRPPRGGRHFCTDCGIIKSTFLSTPSARRATVIILVLLGAHPISIHALREEGDCRFSYRDGAALIFLSTPSARRATRSAHLPRRQHGNFYPRPPRGGRLFLLAERDQPFRISIHALREEGDSPAECSAGRPDISIHALREEGDAVFLRLSTEMIEFLSTPSARRATSCRAQQRRRESGISIHALREEGDFLLAERDQPFRISIHALREEGDSKKSVTAGSVR